MKNTIISASISKELYNFAKKHHISWSEAMKIGIAILLAEKNVIPYENIEGLEIIKKMNFYRKQAEEALQKLEELKK